MGIFVKSDPTPVDFLHTATNEIPKRIKKNLRIRFAIETKGIQLRVKRGIVYKFVFSFDLETKKKCSLVVSNGRNFIELEKICFHNVKKTKR